jgi:putative ABC transport system permease protein
MYVLATFKIAYRNLMMNKMRSFLTILGLLIGVMGVVAIVSMGEGLKGFFAGEIGRLGNDTMYAMPQAPARPGRSANFQSSKPFVLDDVAALQRWGTLFKSVDPGDERMGEAKHLSKSKNVVIEAATDRFMDMYNLEMDKGRPINRRDYLSRARVAVIGRNVRDALFEKYEDPIGQQVRVTRVPFTVVGVIKSKGGFSPGMSMDDAAFVPLSAYQAAVKGNKEVGYIIIKAKDAQKMDDAKAQAMTILRMRRRITDPTRDDFQIMQPKDILKFTSSIVNGMVKTFGVVAVIAWLVGGIGIMNIMLVSVTERTREIGLRMAVGARRTNVLSQFLVEAIVLTLLGGLIGMLVGLLAAFGLSEWLAHILGSSWKPILPWVTVCYTLLVSMGVGIVFGVYPAVKASRMNPIDALRYE